MAEGTITIKGSDTLVRLGQRWAEEYMKNNEDVVIQVSGGGSGTGIAALLNGTTDICEASRDMKEKEYKLANKAGIEPYRVSVALDGIAVYLHKDNPVTELSIADLKGIYTGVIKNWKEVGGPDRRIILYGRENNSGTYAFFKEHVLDKEDYAEETQTLPGTAAVVNAVARDEGGIGYGGIAWAKGVKYAAVRKDEKTAAIEPSVETVSNGSYPISRDLYWFFNGKPTGELKKLLNWALSPAGQKLAEEIDYVPLPKELAEANMVD
jgi:phosphate transport system substrate-binding protein